MVNDMTTKEKVEKFIKKRLVRSHKEIPDFEIIEFSINKTGGTTIHSTIKIKSRCLFLDELKDMHVQHVGAFDKDHILIRIVAYPPEIKGVF